MATMKISVALCTFNGQGFLPQQLKSIIAQTRTPDEIVLCDDASDDHTIRIARRYESQLPLQIITNPQRQGTTSNFSGAIEACTGDVIFLCDQDDIWEPDKVERIASRFSESPSPGLVFSNAALIDQHSDLIGSSLWGANRFSFQRRKWFEQGNTLAHLLRSNIVTGATAAFRREFKDVILPIPQNWVHDYWIATVIASLAPIYSDPALLTRYRIHPAQQIGIHKNNMSKFMALLSKTKDLCVEHEKYSELKSRIVAAGDDFVVPEKSVRSVEQKLNHLARRIQIGRSSAGSFWTLIGEVYSGNYSRFSYGLVDILSDAHAAARPAK
jgi:glycosyltransferase involved in cell wall biosynthesis